MENRQCSIHITISDFKKSDELKTTIRQYLQRYQEMGCKVAYLQCDGRSIALNLKSN